MPRGFPDITVWLLYGVTEMINSLKFHSDKRKYAKAQEMAIAEEVVDEEKVIEAEEVTASEEAPASESDYTLPEPKTEE